jgi:phospholipid transport system substrate-binding protein
MKNWIRSKYLCPAIFAFLLVFVGAPSVMGGEPTERIRQTTDKIIAVVTNPSLKDPSMAGERKSLIRKAVDERFDWEQMSKSSLGIYWRQRSEEERKEFIDLYGKLLERTYLDKVEGYSGEKVSYEGETIDGNYAVVDVKIVTAKEMEIPVTYRLRQKEGNWLVYDISIEGVSLVNNYRVQFSNIISRSSYLELVEKLKIKVEGL